MFVDALLAVVALTLGCWCLFYAERAQIRLQAWHEKWKRTQRASHLFLWVGSRNYELPLRCLGGALLVAFVVLVLLIGRDLEHLR
jgi:hypothetical protein